MRLSAGTMIRSELASPAAIGQTLHSVSELFDRSGPWSLKSDGLLLMTLGRPRELESLEIRCTAIGNP